MSSGLGAAPDFDRSRAFYVGLNKVADAYTVGTHHVPTRSYDAKVRGKAWAGFTPAGPVGAASASGSIESGIASAPVSDPAARGQLLAIAPQVFAEFARESQRIDAETSYEVGRTYHYTGKTRFRVRTHDDFREEEQLDNAPRLGIWLVEIPDSEPGAEAESVTWVVLSGTAQGQLVKSQLGGQVSDWRGGSQTEHLFELLAAKMRNEKRSDTDERWLRDPYYALAARNLLQDSAEQTVEILFTCMDAHGCPIEGERAEHSYLHWGPASTDREVPVSRVILGTPYFVQLTRAAAKKPTGEELDLLERFRNYFGEKRRSVWAWLRAVFER